MRNFRFFSRRVRILSLCFFLGVVLFCKVPSTPVSLCYATLATAMEFFDDRWIYYVDVQKGSTGSCDLSLEGRARTKSDLLYRSVQQIKLLTRDNSASRERYELLSWKKLTGLWTKPEPVEVPGRGNIAVGWVGDDEFYVISGGATIAVPRQNVTYHPISVGQGPTTTGTTGTVTYPNRR